MIEINLKLLYIVVDDDDDDDGQENKIIFFYLLINVFFFFGTPKRTHTTQRFNAARVLVHKSFSESALIMGKRKRHY